MGANFQTHNFPIAYQLVFKYSIRSILLDLKKIVYCFVLLRSKRHQDKLSDVDWWLCF